VQQLVDDLLVVADEVHVEGAVVRYRARRRGIYGDRALPPEIAILTALERLRDQKRLVIVGLSSDGREMHLMLRCGLEVVVAPLA
jgi:hypothetical protein